MLYYDALQGPAAVALGLKAAAFAFSPAISPAPRLRPFPPHQLDFDLCPARARSFMVNSLPA